MAKQAFVMYDSWGEMFLDLDPEDAGKLIQAIYSYRKDKGYMPEKSAVRAMFKMIKDKLDADDEVYKETCEKNRQKAAKRWSANDATACHSINGNANDADLDKELDKELDKDLELDKGLDKESLKGHKTSCSEQSSEPVPDCEALILNDGSDWYPSVEMFAEYQRLYPGVDIQQQFRAMRSWCLGNPKKRKTKSGINRFVTSWLSKEQNRGRASPIFAENKFAVADAWARGEL